MTLHLDHAFITCDVGAQSYRPAYLPPPMSIEIVQGLSLIEPALFWIPSLRIERRARSEPVNHKAPVSCVSKIALGLPFVRSMSQAARHVREAELLDVFEAPSPVLEVHFQAEHDGLIDCRPGLPLVFVGTVA